MNGRTRGPVYPVPDRPVACPFCGNALAEGRFHHCREMEMDGRRPHPDLLPLRVTPRIANWLLAVLAVLIFAYLGAYLLVSLGVGGR